MSGHTDQLQAPADRRDAHVEEQFHSAGQQREAATLGMWAFLATEILFFGGLFVAYVVYRIRWPDDFRRGSLELKWYLGAFNTAVLLLSSFYMAMAVRASQQGDNGKIIRYLLFTMALAVCFLGVKFSEYYLEYDEGLVPGASFRVDPPTGADESAFTRAVESVERGTARLLHRSHEPERRAEHEQLFMIFYFIMTAVHATHMLVGIGLMTWLILAARRGRFSAAWHNPVEIIGLYWHFVDTVWVFLFPILYLLRNP